jgi:hypothetical protein
MKRLLENARLKISACVEDYIDFKAPRGKDLTACRAFTIFSAYGVSLSGRTLKLATSSMTMGFRSFPTLEPSSIEIQQTVSSHSQSQHRRTGGERRLWLE